MASLRCVDGASWGFLVRRNPTAQDAVCMMRIATLAHADEAKRAKLVELELAGRLHIFDQDFKSALPSRGWEVNLLGK